MTPEERRAIAEKNVRYVEGFMWVTNAPCNCNEPGCNREEEYCGETREEAIHNAMTEIK